MNIRYIPIIIILLFSSCSNRQNIKIGNYYVHGNSPSLSNKLEASILKAHDLFKAYCNKNPKKITLHILDSIAHLKHNPSTEEKEDAEAYLSPAPEKLTRVDTLEIKDAFKNKLSGTTLVYIDSLGNVLRYFSGFESLIIGKNTKITSDTTKRYDKNKNKNEIVFLKDLKQSQLIDLAMMDYYSNNKSLEEDIHCRHFLWLNFFYEYFEVNQSSPTNVRPQWLLNFPLVDALNLKAANDYKSDSLRLFPLKEVFNGSDVYETDWKFNTVGKHNLFIPRKDDVHSEKWKYIILNLSNQFTSENRTFNQSILVVNFLKEKFGKEVIKDLTSWYVDNNRGPLLITSFLKEKYKIKSSIQDLNQDYLNWIKVKNY